MSHQTAFIRFCVLMVKVSRPGFYHVTFACFLVPAVLNLQIILCRQGLLGILYAVFPTNLFVYAMNDLADVDIDMKNPRKGGLHGAVASPSELRSCLAIATVILVISTPLLTRDLLWSSIWLPGVMIWNWLYNFGPQFSRTPIVDLFFPLGYLQIIPFSCKVLDVSMYSAPLSAQVFIVLVCFRTQLWLQRMDMEADAKLGKRTTAVFLGKTCATGALFVIMLGEVLCGLIFGNAAALLWSSFSACVLTVEIFLKNAPLTMAAMLFGGLGTFLYFLSSLP